MELEVRKERRLFDLMHKVFLAHNIEDFIRLVGLETRSIKNKIGELILCCHSAYFGPRQYCLKRKRLYERFPKELWPVIESVRSNNQDRFYLAQELGRPIYKVLALPLHSSEYTENSVLFIEYFSKTKTIENIFPQEKLEILQTAFYKVLSEEHWKSGCELWKNTFDSLEEPLVIWDNERKPVRSNTHFKRMYNINPKVFEEDCFTENGEIYEKQTCSVNNKEKNYIIDHFTNITSYLHLKEKVLQNQRMSVLGKLADDFAHQLNNPLTGIHSMAQILVQEDQEKENFQEIEKAAQHCQKIITNFIQFSKQTQKDSTCDLNEIIQQTIPFLKTMIHTKSLTLDLEKNSFLVQAEPCLLQQVIFNLVRNALQAISEQGKVHIQSQFKGDHAWFYVTDNGCGISKDHLKKIFDPFFTTKSSGTGLGLRISYQLIQQFGGKLGVQSEIDQGTCFSFYLKKALNHQASIRGENENINY